MKTLLIGKMHKMEKLLHWLACAEEAFELELLQFPGEKIKMEMEVTAFLTPGLKMDYYAKWLDEQHQSKYRNDNIWLVNLLMEFRLLSNMRIIQS